MELFKILFSPKRQRIIETVRNYYSGKTFIIPYSTAEIKKTMEWVVRADIENKPMLLEKLVMAELLVRSKESSKLHRGLIL